MAAWKACSSKPPCGLEPLPASCRCCAWTPEPCGIAEKRWATEVNRILDEQSRFRDFGSLSALCPARRAVTLFTQRTSTVNPANVATATEAYRFPQVPVLTELRFQHECMFLHHAKAGSVLFAGVRLAGSSASLGLAAPILDVVSISTKSSTQQEANMAGHHHVTPSLLCFVFPLSTQASMASPLPAYTPFFLQTRGQRPINRSSSHDPSRLYPGAETKISCAS